MSKNTKQTTEQLLANWKVFQESILPAKLANSKRNISAFDEWLDDHCVTKEDLVDASVENLKAACAPLHRAGRLIWDVAPKKADHERQALRETDPLGLKSRHDALEASAKGKDRNAATALIQRLKLWAASPSRNRNHAVRERIKEALAKMLPASTAGITLAQAEALEKAMRLKADSMEK